MLNLPGTYGLPVAVGEAPVDSGVYAYSINGLSLCSDGISIKNFNFESVSDISMYDRPLRDGKGILSRYFRGRNISFQVTIKGSTQTEFLERLDAFRKAIYTKEAFLDRKVGDTVRRVKVICKTAPINFEHYNITWGRFDVSFETAEEAEYETNFQDISVTGVAESIREEITNAGTLPSFPKMYFFVNSADTVTQIKVKIGENEIEINEDISASDVVIFDTEEMTVTINGTEVEWDGDIPYLENGSNFIDFTINGTFELDILVLYRMNYV